MKKVFIFLFLIIILACAFSACQSQNQLRNITIKYDDSVFINEEEAIEYIYNMWRWCNEQTGQATAESIRFIDQSKIVPKEQIAEMFTQSWKDTKDPVVINISYIKAKAWYFVSIYSTDNLSSGSEYVVDAMTGTTLVNWVTG